MYKISIIIPVYNVERYLDDCIRSLVEQTIRFENLEVIMADDCSSDGSREMMESYEREYRNVKCIYLDENSGAAGRPRNEAMKMASAKYVMFLDPDDIFYKDACKRLLQVISETGADLVSGYFSILDENGVVLEENAFTEKLIEQRAYEIPKDMWEFSKFKTAFWCKIYKKELLEREHILFPEKIIGSDSVFMWNYLFHTKKVYYTPELVYGYKQRKGSDKSVSYTLTIKHFEDILESMKLIYELFMKHGWKDKLDYAFEAVNAYYIHQMIDSELTKEVLFDILEQWSWLLKTAQEDNDLYAQIIMNDIWKENIEGAAEKIILLRKLKNYVREIEEARNWWHKQSDEKDRVIEELKNTNKELKKWTEELEEAKEYYLMQMGQLERQNEELKMK